MTIWTRLLAVTLGVSAMLGAPQAAEIKFPTHPVSIIVPFPPGGATDTLTRLIADKLSQRWKQTVLVENRPGGNTIIGTEAVANSKPDGHTLGVVTLSHIINPLLTDKLPYDTQKDLTGVMQLTRFHMALYANPKFPADTPEEFVKYVKERQGAELVPYGSATTAAYLGMALMGMMGDFKMQYVPYKGSAQVQTDLVAGHIMLAIDPVLISTLQFVDEGRLKIIGTMGTERAELPPKSPVMADAIPGFEFIGMFGLIAQGKTPPELVRYIRDEVADVMALPEVAKQIAAIGQEAVVSTPDEYNALIRSEVEKWKPVVKATGATL